MGFDVVFEANSTMTDYEFTWFSGLIYGYNRFINYTMMDDYMNTFANDVNTFKSINISVKPPGNMYTFG